MVVVPHTSVDQVKLLTEHDVLKFVGTVATALLIPLMMWSFISLHNTLNSLGDKVVDLHEQVAVLKVELTKQREHIAAEFDSTKSQVRASTLVMQGLRSDTGDLMKTITLKAAKRK